MQSTLSLSYSEMELHIGRKYFFLATYPIILAYKMRKKSSPVVFILQMQTDSTVILPLCMGHLHSRKAFFCQ